MLEKPVWNFWIFFLPAREVWNYLDDAKKRKKKSLTGSALKGRKVHVEILNVDKSLIILIMAQGEIWECFHTTRGKSSHGFKYP